MSEKNNIEQKKDRIDHIENILASVAAGDMDARVNSETEDELSGIEAAIDLLIDDLTDELKQREKELPRFKEPIPVVFAGGLTQAVGFIKKVEELVKTIDFNIKIGDIRVADDPMKTVANGCMLAANL